MNTDSAFAFIQPNWPAPDHIRAVCTTRKSPVDFPENSLAINAYAGFNLAAHVGDDPCRVQKNRKNLRKMLRLPSSPFWLNQQHTDCLLETPDLSDRTDFDSQAVFAPQELDIADASWTKDFHRVCVVMTADCLPVLICDRDGEVVSAIHAGWQGIYKNILEKTIQALPKPASELMAWIGPGISQQNFEVGVDFKEKFRALKSETGMDFDSFFRAQGAGHNGKYLADLSGMAKMQLNRLGVEEVYCSNLCTYQQEDRFYSYRRACHDGNGKTGRMASLIWIDED